ncbi:hypothetical protein SOVF_030160 [Spinacia oleracea]|uniref:DUF7887 domain-containing protein n=1 Tax=Spinacia oleracea TaxID=3562 RepID=A0ABM3RWB9_SPIOL|nr:uncharacterized protein LOC130472576 [Spinacia oleracea]KNA22883.1 hypothetical protein SOVF_030160 [Spinacia oleracea]
MLLSGKSFLCTKISPHFYRNKSKRFTKIFAKKPEFPEFPNKNQKSNFEFRVTNNILAQSAIAILGLGFVDAGYSGDWSRIGVISKQTEDVLKIGAFLVVPLCLFVVLSLAKKPEE